MTKDDRGFSPQGNMIVQEQLGTLTAEQVHAAQDTVAEYAIDSPGQPDAILLFEVLGLPRFRVEGMWRAGDDSEESQPADQDIRSALKT